MKKILLILAILSIVGFSLWFFLRKNKNSATSDSFSGGTGSSFGDNFPLKQGSRGANVSRLQNHLNKLIENANSVMAAVSSPDPLLSVDEIFGPKTEKEVLRFYSVKEVSKELFIQKNM